MLNECPWIIIYDYRQASVTNFTTPESHLNVQNMTIGSLQGEIDH